MRATTIFAVTLLCVLWRLAVRGPSAADAQSRAATRLAHDRPDGGAATSIADAGVARAAEPGDAPIACASDTDCRGPGRRGGRCFTPELAAQYTQAFRDCAEGQAWRAAHTPGTCVFDECHPAEEGRSADTCGAGQRCGTLDMAPFPQRVCVPSACESDFSCRRQVGGRCASYLAAGRCQRGGWACSYPSDVCAPRDPRRMCPVQRGAVPFCAPRNGRFICVQEAVPPQPVGT